MDFGEVGGKRTTQNFGAIEVENVDESLKEKDMLGLDGGLTFDHSFKVGKKVPGHTVSV